MNTSTKTKFAIGAALSGAAIFGAVVSGLSSAEQNTAQPSRTNFSELEETEIKTIIREYLDEHPEVVFQALQNYQVREREILEENLREGARENLVSLIDESTAFVGGADPDKAEIVVVELFDYHCSACKVASAEVQNVVESDEDVKVIFRDLPFLAPESEFAAQASLAAREQDNYVDFHFDMMNYEGLLTKDRVQSFAEKNGLDFAALEIAAKSEDIANTLIKNQELAMSLDPRLRTPLFVIATKDGSHVDVMAGFHEIIFREKLEQAKAAFRN
ncbi:MAG: thioredoxin domain-containing protein [Pseudomonadota bacterium]